MTQLYFFTTDGVEPFEQYDYVVEATSLPEAEQLYQRHLVKEEVESPLSNIVVFSIPVPTGRSHVLEWGEDLQRVKQYPLTKLRIVGGKDASEASVHSDD